MNADRNAIDNLFKEFHYADDLGVIKSKLTEYVTTVRQETWQEAFKAQCVDCAEGDEPVHDAQARWFYHGEGREQVGCSASKLRIEAAANSVPEDSEGDGYRTL